MKVVVSVVLNEGGRLFCVILNRRSEFWSLNHVIISFDDVVEVLPRKNDFQKQAISTDYRIQ
jgi:hypothetical protein